MDEQTRYKILSAVHEASIEAGRPINAAELLRVYAVTTGSVISESEATQGVKELQSLGDVSVEIFKDAAAVERVQRIEVTKEGHKFMYEVRVRPRHWLTDNKKWVITTLITIIGLMLGYFYFRMSQR